MAKPSPSSSAPKADDSSRADVELLSLEEGRGGSSASDLIQTSALRGTAPDSTSQQSDPDSDSSQSAEPVDQTPDLPDLVALTPHLLNMLRAVHVSYLSKHFQLFCSNVYFQASGPLMLNVRSQLKACQGAGILPLQALSKGEKWTVSTMEDKELKKSVQRSWDTYWAAHSSPSEIKKMVTKDMQKQVKAVVHGQDSDFLRSICLLDETNSQWSSHFPQSAFPSPSKLIQGFERQPSVAEPKSFRASGVPNIFPMQASDLNPREQAVDSVQLPSQFSAHGQGLFTHISPSFSLKDVMEDVEQDDTKDLKVRDGPAQAVVIRLLSGTSKYVAEKAMPHAVNLLEELLKGTKIESERWTEKDAWEWVENMENEDGDASNQLEEWQRSKRSGTVEEKTRVAQVLWKKSWDEVNRAREQALLFEQQAEDHEVKNEHAKAIESWTKALQFDPRSEARIRFKRGNCYRASDQLLEAEKDFVALLEIQDHNASQYHVLARPALKKIRQKLKVNVSTTGGTFEVTSPDPSGSKSKKSKKKKKGSISAPTATSEAGGSPAEERRESVAEDEVKETPSAAPSSPEIVKEDFASKDQDPVTPPAANGDTTPQASASEPASVDGHSSTVQEKNVPTAFFAKAFVPAFEESSPGPSAVAQPPPTPSSTGPEPQSTSAVPRNLLNGSTPLESFSSASSTVSSSSSSVPPVASSSTSLSAETATGSPATARSEKRDVSLDREPSPLIPPQHPIDPMALAPQGRMLVERQYQPPPPQHQQHQQQHQHWREPPGYYPPFQQHPGGPYPMYHPHPHAPPPPQHNGYPMYRNDAHPELSFASLASPGPYYGAPPPHFANIMQPPQPFYHIPAPLPPPPPPAQPVFRDTGFSPRVIPARPIQIQRPPVVKPSAESEVPSPRPTPSLVEPSSSVEEAPAAQPTTSTSAPTTVPAPAEPPVASSPAIVAPREKQPPVPMEFEDGIILFVCSDFAATGGCSDSDCPHLHEQGVAVEFNDPSTYTYPTEEVSSPAQATFTVVEQKGAAEAPTKVEAPASSDDTSQEASTPRPSENVEPPAVKITAVEPAPESIAPSSTEASRDTVTPPPAPLVSAINGTSTTTPSAPAPSPAPKSSAISPTIPKPKPKAPPADRWWEKGANGTSTAAKEEDWATAGKKPKKPTK